jgi:hypothetical protein
MLVEPLGPIRQVYFRYSGVICFEDGHLVQTGFVCRDGAVGALLALKSLYLEERHPDSACAQTVLEIRLC